MLEACADSYVKSLNPEPLLGNPLNTSSNLAKLGANLVRGQGVDSSVVKGTIPNPLLHHHPCWEMKSSSTWDIDFWLLKHTSGVGLGERHSSSTSRKLSRLRKIISNYE
jgi:hypothetical protein